MLDLSPDVHRPPWITISDGRPAEPWGRWTSSRRIVPPGAAKGTSYVEVTGAGAIEARAVPGPEGPSRAMPPVIADARIKRTTRTRCVDPIVLIRQADGSGWREELDPREAAADGNEDTAR